MIRIFQPTGPLRAPPTEGPDVIVGTDEHDYVMGGGGDDIIWGRGGADNLSGGTGNDQLHGEGGDDFLSDIDSGNDQLWGDAGDDRLTVSRLGSTGATYLLSGGDGDDFIRATVTRNEGPLDTLSILGGNGDDEAFVMGPLIGTADLGAGNDLFVGGTTGGFDLRLGAGHDVAWVNQRGQIIVILDFEVGENGDRIDLQRSIDRLASGNTPDVNPFYSGVARLEQVGADTIVRVGTHAAFRLVNVSATSLTASNFSGWSPTGGPTATGGNFWGSNRPDDIWASYGADHIEALGGDDLVLGQDGNDLILGGVGSDRLNGGMGDDVIYGGDGWDSFEESVLSGGNDIYHGEGGTDSVYYRERLNGAAERITFFGGGGDDYVNSDGGRLGDLIVEGGEGDDGVGIYNVDRWRVDGGAGDDGIGLIYAYRNASLFFGTGTFDGGEGKDSVGLDDHSSLLPIVGVDAHSFRIGASTMVNVEGLQLSALDNRLDLSGMTHGLIVDGNNGNDTLIGSAFDDVLIGGMGQDRLEGGAGYDTAVFSMTRSNYLVVTVGGVTTVTNIGVAADIQGSDDISGIERMQFADGWYDLNGARLPSVISGSAAADVLEGEAFSDVINAGAGNDVIHATGGKDIVDGGDGDDRLEVWSASQQFRLEASGDDFILIGREGATRLTGVETVRFMDGVVLELNRMYGESWEPGPAAKGGEPLILPGEPVGSEFVQRPGLVLHRHHDLAGAEHGLGVDLSGVLSHGDWSW